MKMLVAMLIWAITAFTCLPALAQGESWVRHIVRDVPIVSVHPDFVDQNMREAASALKCDISRVRLHVQESLKSNEHERKIDLTFTCQK